MNYITKNLAECYILIAILFYWIATATFFNPIAIVLLLLFGYLLNSHKKALGVALGVLFLVLNLYMCFALISELTDYTTATSDPMLLFVAGSIFLGINLIAALSLILKYAKFPILKQL